MTPLRTAALVAGIFYLLVGLLGLIFVPQIGDLFGIFYVDTLHNLIHIVVGVLGIGVAFTNYSKLYFQVFAVVFLLLGIFGFLLVPNRGPLLGVLSVNVADHLLHLATGLIFAYLGFVYRGMEEPTRAGMA